MAKQLDQTKQAKLENIKTVVKAIVIPYKTGITIDQIQKDYRELEGQGLPYAEFGFQNPRQFVDSMKDTLNFMRGLYGDTLYLAKYNEDTNHIQEMVMRQKAPPKKKKKRPLGGLGGYGSYYGGHRYNVKPSNSYWNGPVSWGNHASPSRPPVNFPIRRPVLPAGIEKETEIDEWGPTTRQPVHPPTRQPVRPPTRQPVRPPNRQPVRPPVSSKTPSKQPLRMSQLNNTQNLTSNKPPAGPANNMRASAPLLSAQDLQNIKDLLKEHGKDGITMNLFKVLYEQKYKESLNPHSKGFADLQHALSSIGHICKVELHPSNKYYIVKLADNLKKEPSKNSKKPISPKNNKDGHKGPADNSVPNSPRKVVIRSENLDDLHVELVNGVDSEALENFPKTAISYFNKILDKHPNGVTATKFLSEYEIISGASLEPTNWGYFSLIDIFYGLPSLFFVDPADSRSGQDTDQDVVVYHSKKVPADVRQRVDDFHARTNKPPKSEKEVRWGFKLKIMALLMEAADGISIGNFSTDFYLNFKESLDPTLYDYKDYNDMFQQLTKELPIKMEGSYSGDDCIVSLLEDWESKWVDICVENNQYEALKQMVVPETIVLPGDPINEVDVEKSTVDADFWHQIILTSVVNPNCIFVNIVGKYHSDALDTLMSKMKFYAGLDANCRDYDVPKCYLRDNLFCVAAFDVDNCWHRVKIVKVDPDKKKVKIAFIDFGGEQFIEASKLRLMKKEFSYLPSQAIRLSLRGIRAKSEKWPANAKDEVLDFMHRALNQKENILARFHTRKSPHAKESVRFEAEVCAKTPLGYVFLHKQLIESGLAIIDEEATLPPKSDIMIPSNDVHRPVRKPMRVNPRKMISTLKRLQSLNKGSDEPANKANDQ